MKEGEHTDLGPREIGISAGLAATYFFVFLPIEVLLGSPSWATVLAWLGLVFLVVRLTSRSR